MLLDAGGVLLLPDPDAFRRELERFSIVPDDATCARGHFEAMREADRLRRDDYVGTDRFLARWFGVPDSRLEEGVAAIDAVYTGHRMVPIAGAAENLVRLRDAGFGLAIVSNATGTMEAQLAEHRICSVDGHDCADVAVVIDSHVVGVSKPDPAIFGFALDALAIGAEQCVFLGDSVYFDVEGALAAGIRPVHVDPFDLCDGGYHDHTASLAAFTEGLLRSSPTAGRR